MLLHLGQNVITFRTLLHLGQNVITFRTLLHLGPFITFRPCTNGLLNPGSVGKMWTDPGKSQKSDCPTLEFVGEDRLIVFSSTWNDGLG